MSQKKVMELLEKNPNTYLSAKEIANHLKINIQSVSTSLRKLKKNNDVRTKHLKSAGVEGFTKLYGFIKQDEVFEKTLFEFNLLRTQKRFEMVNADSLYNVMILTELKKMRELLENAKK